MFLFVFSGKFRFYEWLRHLYDFITYLNTTEHATKVKLFL